MYRLIIEREPTSDQGTLGTAELYVPAGIMLWQASSLELPDRGNQSDISCILPGLYVAEYVFSEKFGRKIYALQGVPGREACELHIGNWAGDVSLGWKSDVEGCTIFGTEHGFLQPPGFSRPQLAVLHSEIAFDELVVATGGATIEVEYKWKVIQ